MMQVTFPPQQLPQQQTLKSASNTSHASAAQILICSAHSCCYLLHAGHHPALHRHPAHHVSLPLHQSCTIMSHSCTCVTQLQQVLCTSSYATCARPKCRFSHCHRSALQLETAWRLHARRLRCSAMQAAHVLSGSKQALHRVNGTSDCTDTQASSPQCIHGNVM